MAWLTADDLAAFDGGLGNAQQYDPTALTAVIADVEAEIERIIGVAYDRRTVTDEWHLGDGGCWLKLDHRWPVSVSAASIDGAALSAGTLSDLTIDRISGALYLSSGWTAGKAILVSYVHGRFNTAAGPTYTTAAPADLLRAAKILCRARIAEQVSPVIDRNMSWMPDGGGGMFRIAQPTATSTGVPAVDAVLARYIVPGIA